MQKHKSIFVFFGVLLLGSISIGAFIIFEQFGGGSSDIHGTVFKVVDRPNAAEDGYYGISVQAANGQDYVIDATGYRNSPTSPADHNQTCVDIPRVSAGDRVAFSLPQSTSYAHTYVTCHEKTATGYYFTVK